MTLSTKLENTVCIYLEEDALLEGFSKGSYTTFTQISEKNHRKLQTARLTTAIED